ncbi:hypothetical protein [Pseudothauera rhizosphaerae]|uniref:Uncharacterized protein n=1 Tax=Pseudothauera rhizosphaerae TaxID=2565932 RepID=A0A4S4AHC3_9RHOO|nr:hypothetical protein [Pseudothauera rhizosphaerae]THF58672.1 hypothetical protein E6O51_16925 [Pseudothauera rhizosphaerae]
MQSRTEAPTSRNSIASDSLRPRRDTAVASSAAECSLAWRTPWLSWQAFAWLTATLMAPPFWGIGLMLMIDARSDHPAFWPSAMAAVAISQFVAILSANQCHHRRPFRHRSHLLLWHWGISTVTAGVLLLLVGWWSGFLPGIFSGSSGAAVAGIDTAVLWSLATATGFGLLSSLPGGLVCAWLNFTRTPAHSGTEGLHACL